MPIFLRWLLRLVPLNPIAVRLVQNGSRRARHMYIRSAYLALLIVALLWLLLIKTSAGSLSYRELAAAASTAFAAIANVQVFLICILAPVFMGAAIAQESSPRTWEVLLTTPLSATQIVLGNLFGRLFFVVALLGASLPLFALTQYFGGVPGSSIFLSYAIAVCAALVVGAIAIALSVSRAAGKRAFFIFYVAVVGYLGATWAVDEFLQAGVGGSRVTVMTALNPFLTLRALLDPVSYPRAPEGSQTSMILRWLLEKPVTTWCVGSAVLSLVTMIASTVTVRAGGFLGIAGEGGGGVPWYRKMFGFGAANAEHRPPRAVWTNPIAWREAAARQATLGKTVARWVFIGMGALFGVLLIYLFHVGQMTSDEFRLALSATAWAELATIALVAVNTAGTAISREREDGTLDLLLTTPITASAYLKGKLRGLIMYLLPLLAVPVGTVMLAGLYVLVGGLGRSGGVEISQSGGGAVPVVLPEAGVILAFSVLPFMAFCVMLGLNWSLKSKGTIGSVVGTVGVLLGIAGTVGLCAWHAASGIATVGPILAPLSPASAVSACCAPERAMSETVSSGMGGLVSARIALAMGAVVAIGAWSLVCYGIHSAMVRTFDMTVRKLAGQR
ncbi:MAG: ABC transporter permease [Phycisphaerales bacterium]